MKAILATSAVVAIFSAWLFAQPTTAPRDDTLDWLLSQATTAPTTRRADAPAASPFAEKIDADTRKGIITLSDNERIRGRLSTTREKPIRIWVPADKEYRDVPFDLIKSMEAKVLWERDEKEWHFKESGSDIKEYTGKTYPARELEYTVTLVNGQSITGGIVAPIYVTENQKTFTFVLNKRQKGEVGQTLRDLTYIKKVELE